MTDRYLPLTDEMIDILRDNCTPADDAQSAKSRARMWQMMFSQFDALNLSIERIKQDRDQRLSDLADELGDLQADLREAVELLGDVTRDGPHITFAVEMAIHRFLARYNGDSHE